MSHPACCEPRSAADFKRIYDQALQVAKVGAWECRLDTEELIWTDSVYDLFELPRGSTLVRSSIVDLYFDDSRAQMQRLRSDIIRNGGRFTLDARIRTTGHASRWMRLTAEAVHEHGRPSRIFGAKQDITHEKQLWDQLRRFAEQDSLTGLANRRVFEARCGDLANAADDGSVAALALIDLDGFKQINDRFGHSAGDECLRQIAERLRLAFDDAVVIARMGGDEFAVLMRAPLGCAQLAHTLERARRVLGRPVLWRDAPVAIGASIGVTLLKRPCFQGTPQLFAEADSALYLAKAAGRNVVQVFGGEIADRRRQRPRSLARPPR
jgi:diguanylate cyclase (GGDEF)-like protein